VPSVPYCGIRPFRYRDHPIFFAREQETQRLGMLVSVYRGVLLYGDSGAGKSSLVNAGLLPDIVVAERFSPERVRVQPRPGEELVVERIAVSEDDPPALLPSLLAGDVHGRERMVLSLTTFLTRLEAACEGNRPLLIFDQFEEIVTLFDEAGAGDVQRAIVRLVVELLQGTLPVKLLFAFRDDYLGRLREMLRACPELIDQSLRLAPPSVAALPTIISGPFERYPDHFAHPLSPALGKELVAVLSKRFASGELSLSEVQIVCLRLWQSEDPEALLTAKGPQGLLEDYLGEALDEMPQELRPAAIALLSEMITGAGTRNVISAEDLFTRVREEGFSEPQAVLTVALKRLSESRLVGVERRRDLDLYEITSEFLVPWISKRRDELRRAQERRRERRRMRILGSIAGVLLVIVAAVAALAIWALHQRSQARTEATTARSLALAADAQANAGSRLDVALQLALAALAPARGGGGAALGARSAMIDALELSRSQGVTGILSTGGQPVQSVAFSPVGEVLAAGEHSGAVTLWNPVTHRITGTLDSPDRTPIDAVSFSSDGKLLASGGANGDVRVWDVSDARPIGSFSIGRKTAVTHLAFSHDGRLLGVGGLDGGVRIWGVDARHLLGAALTPSVSGPFLPSLTPPLAQGVVGLGFSPDGHTIAAGEADLLNRVFVWDVRGHRQLAALNPHTFIDDVAFSPDGSRVALAGFDDAELWSLRNHRRVLRPLPVTSGIAPSSVALSPDGGEVAAADRAGVVRAWSVRGGARIGALTTAADSNVNGIAFSPDGHRLAIADSDGTVTLWDPALTGELGTVLPHSAGLQALAYSPDGTRLAAGDDAGRVRLWRLPGETPVATLSTHDPSNAVSSITFSPDGRRLAVVDFDNRLTMFDAGTGSTETVVRTLDSGAVDIAIGFDEHRIATVDLGRAVRLYTLPDGRRLPSLSAAGGAALGTVTFSPIGRELAASDVANGIVWVWRLRAPVRPPMRLATPTGAPIDALAFSPDGRWLAGISEDGTARLWSTSTGAPVGTTMTAGSNHYASEQSSSASRSLPGETTIAFSPDGRTIVTQESTDLRLWDAATTAPLGGDVPSIDAGALSMGPGEPALALAGPSGIQLVSGILWHNFDELRQEVCGLARNPLDRTTWPLYAPGIPYQRTCEVRP
jgi:WD40 repeat protein